MFGADTKMRDKSRDGLVFPERCVSKQTKNGTEEVKRKMQWPLKLRNEKNIE